MESEFDSATPMATHDKEKAPRYDARSTPRQGEDDLESVAASEASAAESHLEGPGMVRY